MKTPRALALIFIGALLSGVVSALATSAMEKVRPPMEGGLFLVEFVVTCVVLPVAIVVLAWRKTSELRFTGVLVGLAAVLMSSCTSFIGGVATCVIPGNCM